MERWRRYRHPQVYQPERRSGSSALQFAVPKIITTPPRWLWISLLIVFAIYAVHWFFTASPVFRVTSIALAGDTTPELSDWSASLSGKNLFSLQEDRLLSDLQSVDPTVAELVLAKGVPDTIKLTVTRRRPALVWQVGDQRWSVDTEGIIFPYDEFLASGMPIIVDTHLPSVELGSQVVSRDFVAFIQEVMRELPGHLDQAIVRGEIGEATLHVSVVTEAGWQIVFDTTRPLAGQLASLDLVLRDYKDQIKEYVDLRLVGWGYVR